MSVALTILMAVVETLFGTSVDQALQLARNRDWKAASALLDQAAAEDPAAFAANNLYYLRGRAAETQQDWARAEAEFSRIGSTNPLRPLAAWHAARAAIRSGAPSAMDRASQWIAELPPDFPASLRTELAREAPPAIALSLLGAVSTRNARLQRAVLRADTAALWDLLDDSRTDDAALEAAGRLAPVASTPQEWMELAATFQAQRYFAEAQRFFQMAAANPERAAEARYQLARIQFLKQDYAAAAADYQAVAVDFPGTRWQQDAEYQTANSYWRLRRYEEARSRFSSYIDRYKDKSVPEDAIRDLVDIYRSLGEEARALSLIDRTLSGRLTTATRQVLLFSKAKILYRQQKFSAALTIFRQLKAAPLRSTSGGTTADEVRYFEALSLSSLGDAAGARKAFTQLASNPLSYYGHKAGLRLKSPAPTGAPDMACTGASDVVLADVSGRLEMRRRPFRGDTSGLTDAVTELMFMHLWDEASLWLDRTRRPDAALAADLGYISARYDRTIVHAGRMSRSSPQTLPLLYPAAFRDLICTAAAQYKVDPLWLHAIIWQESKYDPAARSGAAARGLMQFIPETAETAAAGIGISGFALDRLYDPETSIRLGAYYWSTLMAEFKDPELALAAFYGGPDNVRRWRDKWPGSSPEFLVADIGFVETKRYVQAVFAARAAYGRLD